MIKKIHCFGTSFTAGGGFEFECVGPRRRESIHKAYASINEEKKQYWFSYPGRLQRLLPNIDVKNYAKQGYGNERLYRKAFEIITSNFFNPEENLFIFEFSWLGRKEFWLNEFENHIIANYRFEENDKVDGGVALAESYHYDSYEKKNKLDEYQDLFNSFFKATYDAWNQREVVERNLGLFFSFLRENKVKFIVTAVPKICLEKDINYIKENNLNINYRIDDWNLPHRKHYTDEIEIVIGQYGWKIDEETDGVWNDFHGGFYFNELVAHLIKNKMIELGHIVGDVVDENILYKTYKDKFDNHKNTI